jgi:hypothetical protein
MLHSSTADPFKLALYKLMGKLESSRRSVPHVTTTTEDWLWFQLAMVTPRASFCINIADKGGTHRWTRRKTEDFEGWRTFYSVMERDISMDLRANKDRKEEYGLVYCLCVASLKGSVFWIIPVLLILMFSQFTGCYGSLGPPRYRD